MIIPHPNGGCQECAIIILMNNLAPSYPIKTFRRSVKVIAIALIVRSLMFLFFALPSKTNPEVYGPNSGPGFLATVVCYILPMFATDACLFYYLIYLLIIRYKSKKGGILLEPAQKNFSITMILFLIWLLFAIISSILIFP